MTPCITAPATPRAAPASSPTTVRGTRLPSTMSPISSFRPGCRTVSSTVPSGIGREPKATESATATARTTTASTVAPTRRGTELGAGGVGDGERMAGAATVCARCTRRPPSGSGAAAESVHRVVMGNGPVLVPIDARPGRRGTTGEHDERDPEPPERRRPARRRPRGPVDAPLGVRVRRQRTVPLRPGRLRPVRVRPGRHRPVPGAGRVGAVRGRGGPPGDRHEAPASPGPGDRLGHRGARGPRAAGGTALGLSSQHTTTTSSQSQGSTTFPGYGSGSGTGGSGTGSDGSGTNGFTVPGAAAAAAAATAAVAPARSPPPPRRPQHRRRASSRSTRS